MRKLAVISILVIAALTVKAQSYISFYQLRDIVPQTSNLQPAYIPDNTFSISLVPNFGAAIQGDPKLQEILSYPDGSAQLTVDLDILSDAAQATNFIGINTSVNLLHASLRTKLGAFSLFANAKVNFDFAYGKDFMDFLADGNSGFIGEAIDFSSNRIRLDVMQEIGVGYARRFLGDRLTVGARAKLVTGIFHASLKDGASASLTTDANDFSWQIAIQNGTVNTAGLDLLFNSDNYSSSDQTSYALSNDNQTVAFDLGAKFKVLDWLEVEAAVNDIGTMNWKEQVRNYNTNDTTVTFSGLQLRGLEDSGNVFEDSVTSKFNSNETRRGFETTLSNTIFLTASGYLTPNDRFSVTYFKRSALEDLPANYAISYNHRFKKFVVGVLSTFRRSNNEVNIGANLGTNIGPVQLYVATDNVLVLNKPETYSKADFRFGLNLMFGYKKWRKQPEVVDLDEL